MSDGGQRWRGFGEKDPIIIEKRARGMVTVTEETWAKLMFELSNCHRFHRVFR